MGQEIIARAIFSPIYIDEKKKRIKAQAFDPYPGTDEVSVMRHSFLGIRRCKEKALEMENRNKIFRGFAILQVEEVRRCKCQVVDSREQFLGHADIRTGLRSPAKGEPRDPQILSQCKEIGRNLVSIASYVEDVAIQT